jgi:hypothetical protein
MRWKARNIEREERERRERQRETEREREREKRERIMVFYNRIEKDEKGNQAAILAFYPSFDYTEVEENEFVSYNSPSLPLPPSRSKNTY